MWFCKYFLVVVLMTTIENGLCSDAVGYEGFLKVKEKALGFHYLFDLFTTDYEGDESIGLSSVYEFELMKFLVNHHNSKNAEKLYGFNYVLVNYLNRTKYLNRYSSSFRKQNEYDFFIGPKNTEKLESIYGMNLILGKLLFSHGAIDPTLDTMGKTLSIARTLPSELFRVNVLLQLVEHYNWNYFALIRSSSLTLHQYVDFIGEIGWNRLIKDYNIHLSFNTDKLLCKFIKDLDLDKNLNIVILFTTVTDSKRTIRCLQENGLYNRFHLIFFYGHNKDPEVFKNNELMLDGSLGIEAELDGYDHLLTEFMEHFQQLSPNNTRSDILQLYWEQQHQCNAFNDRRGGYKKDCTFDEPFEPVEGWNNTHLATEKVKFLPATFDCITDLVNKALSFYCSGIDPENCTRKFVGSRAGGFTRNLILIANNQFQDDFQCHLANFIYNIYNYNYWNNTYEKVFVWQLNNTAKNKSKQYSADWLLQTSEPLFINLTDPWWGNETRNGVPFGNCSRPCSFGFFQKFKVATEDFCWTCVRCKGKNEVLLNNTCTPCQRDQKADMLSQTCVPLPLQTIRDRYFDLLQVIQYIVATLIVLALCISAVVLRYSKTVIFSASGANLWVLMLSNNIVTLISAFFYTRVPSTTTCIFTDIFAPVSSLGTRLFLLAKIFRIQKAFHGRRKRSKGAKRVAGVKHANLFISAFFLLQGVVMAAGTMTNNQYSKSMYEKKFHTDKGYATSHCVGVKFGSLFYSAHLVTGVYLLRQLFSYRSLPHNFNETAYLFVAAVCSCLWNLVVFSGEIEKKDVPYAREFTYAFFLVSDTFCSLIVLYVQKIYLVLSGSHTNGKPKNSAIRLRSYSGQSQKADAADVM